MIPQLVHESLLSAGYWTCISVNRLINLKMGVLKKLGSLLQHDLIVHTASLVTHVVCRQIDKSDRVIQMIEIREAIG